MAASRAQSGTEAVCRRRAGERGRGDEHQGQPGQGSGRRPAGRILRDGRGGPGLGGGLIEPKDVVLALLGASAGLGGFVLVFLGVIIASYQSYAGNVPGPVV